MCVCACAGVCAGVRYLPSALGDRVNEGTPIKAVDECGLFSGAWDQTLPGLQFDIRVRRRPDNLSLASYSAHFRERIHLPILLQILERLLPLLLSVQGFGFRVYDLGFRV